MDSEVLQSASPAVELGAGELDVAREHHVHRVGHEVGSNGPGVRHLLLKDPDPGAGQGLGVLHAEPLGAPNEES